MANLAELLYEALNTELGICVKTNDAKALRQKLYPIRKENEDLACLGFVLSPINGVDLWIIKKPEGAPDAEE